jgi:hypothetical protein
MPRLSSGSNRPTAVSAAYTLHGAQGDAADFQTTLNISIRQTRDRIVIALTKKRKSYCLTFKPKTKSTPDEFKNYYSKPKFELIHKYSVFVYNKALIEAV